MAGCALTNPCVWMGPMTATISQTLLPVPYVWPSASMDDDGGSWQSSRHHAPHNGIVYVGDEQNRTRAGYDASGNERHPSTRLGQIIDLYV
jgi:hypothetical protein